jgi:hypothetical protein
MTTPIGTTHGGLAVRNGSISGFGAGIVHGGDLSIVGGLSVSAAWGALSGIIATGIVKGNTATSIRGTGISATRVVTGKYASGNEIGK